MSQGSIDSVYIGPEQLLDCPIILNTHNYEETARNVARSINDGRSKYVAKAKGDLVFIGLRKRPLWKRPFIWFAKLAKMIGRRLGFRKSAPSVQTHE